MSVEFRFHSKKAVEAASILLKLHGKPMSYLGLLKMLYIADRIALARMDEPITGDNAYSMEYGPVLSTVYDFIKGNDINGFLPQWTNFISKCRLKNHDKKEYYLKLDKVPEIEELCEEEEEILEEVYQQFGNIDPFEVADWTHDLAEWKDPKLFGKRRIPICFDEILKTLGRTQEEIDNIEDEAKKEAYLDEVLNAPCY